MPSPVMVPRLAGFTFTVVGVAVPKQSFRARKDGRHFQSQRVVDWQRTVAEYARMYMFDWDLLTGDLLVSLDFYLPTRRRVDLDNLSKGVLDGLNGVVWEDDKQIVGLMLSKQHDRDNPRVVVDVRLVT